MNHEERESYKHFIKLMGWDWWVVLGVYEASRKQASNKSRKNHHEEGTSSGVTGLCGINTRGKGEYNDLCKNHDAKLVLV